jgi:hypothetical protein
MERGEMEAEKERNGGNERKVERKEERERKESRSKTRQKPKEKDRQAQKGELLRNEMGWQGGHHGDKQETVLSYCQLRLQI